MEYRLTRSEMKQRAINSKNGPEPSGGYSQAVEVSGYERTLYVSGQVPAGQDGSVPETFAGQARLAWKNIEAQLAAAGMTLDNIVKHTTYLADRRYRNENSEIRREVFGGDRAPALTVIIATIYDESWLLEIEAIAVA